MEYNFVDNLEMPVCSNIIIRVISFTMIGTIYRYCTSNNNIVFICIVHIPHHVLIVAANSFFCSFIFSPHEKTSRNLSAYGGIHTHTHLHTYVLAYKRGAPLSFKSPGPESNGLVAPCARVEVFIHTYMYVCIIRSPLFLLPPPPVSQSAQIKMAFRLSLYYI